MIKRKRKIIIIDDDIKLTNELKKILSDAGYLVTIYNSPQFSNKIILEEADIRLIDLWFDGIAAGLNQARAFKNKKKKDQTPVILMSSDPKIKIYAKLVGADRYLIKPFEIEMLLSMIRELLS